MSAQKLTESRRRDLQRMIDESGHGGISVRTGRTLARLGLAMYCAGYAPHGSRRGYMITDAGRAALRGES